MDKRKITFIIIIVLFIVVVIKNEFFSDERKVMTLESVEEEYKEEQELQEGDVEIFGSPKTDYLLEEFELVFLEEAVEEMFVQAQAVDHFKYALYDLLYNEDKGEYTTATVLEDYWDTDECIYCTVQVDENIVVNVEYNYLIDEFDFGFHEIAQRGVTNDYIEVEE